MSPSCGAKARGSQRRKRVRQPHIARVFSRVNQSCSSDSLTSKRDTTTQTHRNTPTCPAALAFHPSPETGKDPFWLVYKDGTHWDECSPGHWSSVRCLSRDRWTYLLPPCDPEPNHPRLNYLKAIADSPQDVRRPRRTQTPRPNQPSFRSPLNPPPFALLPSRFRHCLASLWRKAIATASGTDLDANGVVFSAADGEGGGPTVAPRVPKPEIVLALRARPPDAPDALPRRPPPPRPRHFLPPRQLRLRPRVRSWPPPPR